MLTSTQSYKVIEDAFPGHPRLSLFTFDVVLEFVRPAMQRFWAPILDSHGPAPEQSSCDFDRFTERYIPAPEDAPPEYCWRLDPDNRHPNRPKHFWLDHANNRVPSPPGFRGDSGVAGATVDHPQSTTSNKMPPLVCDASDPSRLS